MIHDVIMVTLALIGLMILGMVMAMLAKGDLNLKYMSKLIRRIKR